ncbi:hypothetical protein V8G54_024171 [Vigna mungo]|uniref:Uncharacterized protein n=1 Tax=Vigna mungo TaxID=3915 RepID=A0AAQ3N5Y3_VIGMU
MDVTLTLVEDLAVLVLVASNFGEFVVSVAVELLLFLLGTNSIRCSQAAECSSSSAARRCTLSTKRWKEYFSMDKSWITKPRNTVEYSIGLQKFLDFAFENRASGDTIRCPCPKSRGIVEEHLILKQFPINYVIWNLHGERQIQDISRNEDESQETFHYENPMETMINEAFGHYRQEGTNIGISQPLGEDDVINERPRENHNEFNEFLNDGNQIFCDGSKYTKLEFVIKLYHIKVLCGLSDKAMTMILDLLRDAFSEAKLPLSFYEAKKIINKLGLNYTKIGASPNHCMLYLRDDEKNFQTCKHCGTSRWNPKKKKKQPAKVLRYFPLKPRLQRLFMCSKTAEYMRWHSSENKDGVIRHPRDGEAWKTFSVMHPEFALDPRNVRLGLASDHTSLILSMIIPGKQMPGNSIGVYLQPLVDELCELWNDGVETFDSSLNETFRMRAALMWTIIDFPGLGILSGLACPTSNFDAEPCRLPHSKKWCFMEHHRFLSRNHRFRLNRVRFDGSTEERNPPLKLSGSNIFRQVENIDVTFGREIHLDRGKRCRQEPKSKDNLNARKDLKEMGIRQDLWPDDNGRYHLTLFSLTRDTKMLFLKTLKNVLVPDGYSSNISRCVDDVQHKISGLKSHDCHIIMEQLLSLAIRNLLPNHVTTTLVEFCPFFKALCSKSLNLEDLDMLQNCIVVTLCHLKMLLPPSFFTVMVHLTVHLVEEAKLGGNKAQPEGSIAEGYLTKESITFCSRYIEDIETRTQNSGFFLTSNTTCVSSTVDRNLMQADLSYYGKLEDIIELNYYGRFKVVIFKCKWVDTTRERGYKKDQWNFNCVNFDRLIHIGNREEHEPYIEASQAQMVYYVDDVVNEGWNVVVHVKPRDLYEMGEEIQEELFENEQYQDQELDKFYSNDNEYVQLATNHLDEDIN